MTISIKTLTTRQDGLPRPVQRVRSRICTLPAVGLLMTLALVAGFVSVAAPPAGAATGATYLCGPASDFSCLAGTGYNGSQHPWGSWGPGHNCTSYVAYRLQQNGVPNLPWPAPIGDAIDWDNKAAAAGITVNSTPAVGSVAQWNTGNDGHVAYVEAVTDTYIDISEDAYLTATTGYTARRRLDRSGTTFTTANFIHVHDVAQPPVDGDGDGLPDGQDQCPLVRGDLADIGCLPEDFVALAGGVQSQNLDKRSDLGYLTGGSGPGIAYAAMLSSGAKPLSWSGGLWSQPSLSFAQIKLAPGDYNGDGIADLGYLTPKGPYGIDFAIMWGTTAGPMTYSGALWSNDSIRFDQIKLVPGDYDGDGKTDLGYMTPKAKGVTFAVFMWDGNANALAWQDIWWDDNTLDITGIRLVPADVNGDGKTDLGYVTGGSSPGIAYAAMLSSGARPLAWSGVLWSQPSLTFGQIKLAPGDYNGDGIGDLGYLTPQGPYGVAFAIMWGSATGPMTWSGILWTDANIRFDQIKLAPGDYDGNGKTDLGYMTPKAKGLTFAVFKWNGADLEWQDIWWDDNTLDINQIRITGSTQPFRPSPPGAPTTVAAAARAAEATVTWNAPASDGGAPITGYTVTSSPGAKTCVWTSGPLSCTVTGLTNGTGYTFTVTATNTSGTGPASVASPPVMPISGFYFHPLAPQRILDSRSSNGGWNTKLAQNPKTLTVTGGPANVPAGAAAVIVNVTVTGSNAPSFLTVYPTGATVPGTSSLNFAAGETIPNLVTVKVGSNGQVSFANAVGATDVIVDIVGYFDRVPADRYNALPPARILDSRGTTGGWNSKLSAATPKMLQVRGAGGVPAAADAVIVNVTATGGTANSFLTVYPAGGASPTASNVNFAAGQTIPNLVTVKIGSGGNIAIANAVGATDVIIDVVGYFATTGDVFHPINPVRALDSRGTTGGWNAKLAVNNPRTLTMTGVGGMPPGATAVIGNTTVTDGTANSFLTVYPAGQSVPTASNVNFAAGQTIPNLAAVKIGANGQIAFANAVGSTHVVFDVDGYFTPN